MIEGNNNFDGPSSENAAEFSSLFRDMFKVEQVLSQNEFTNSGYPGDFELAEINAKSLSL